MGNCNLNLFNQITKTLKKYAFMQHHMVFWYMQALYNVQTRENPNASSGICYYLWERNKSFIQFFVLICYSHCSLRCPWFHTDRQELSGCNRGYGVPPTMEKAFQDPPEDACSCSSYRSVWLMHCSHSLTHRVPPPQPLQCEAWQQT